jgi:hypothetical protein
MTIQIWKHEYSLSTYNFIYLFLVIIFNIVYSYEANIFKFSPSHPPNVKITIAIILPDALMYVVLYMFVMDMIISLSISTCLKCFSLHKYPAILIHIQRL